MNNAAIAARLPTADLDAALIDDMYAVNVRAPLLLVAALIPAMIERGSGSIINLSSVSGVVGTPRRAAYAATKGAIDAATRSLAMELGPHGIRVNSVAPGVVDTDLWARNKAIPGVIEGIDAQTALRRWSQPDDIADVIVFLASDAAALRHRRDDLGRRRHGPHPRPLRRRRLTPAGILGVSQSRRCDLAKRTCPRGEMRYPTVRLSVRPSALSLRTSRLNTSVSRPSDAARSERARRGARR